MKRIIRHISLLLCCIALTTGFLVAVSAHPGKTDSSGGHYDHSTGEYHYHHGYSAHSHYDVDGDGITDCPYNFDDKTSHSSGSLASGNSISARETAKEVSIISTWNKWGLAVFAFSILILIIVNHFKKKDILELENQIEQHRLNAKKIELENHRLIEENDQLQNDLSSVISAIDIGTPYFPKNVQVDLSLYKIDIPDDIYFTDSNIPIKGTASKDRPYGEYTVFLSKKSDIYHTKSNCGSAYNLQPFHLFEILGKKRPCQRCVREPYTEIPKWYAQLMELCNRLLKNP